MRTLWKKIHLLAITAILSFSCHEEKTTIDDKVVDENIRQLSFSIIRYNYYSSVENQSVVRVTTANELATVWNQIYSLQNPLPPIPAIDFNKDMCLFIFLGSRPNSGYSVELKQVLETSASIRLKIKETVTNNVTTQGLMSPHLVAILAKNLKPLESEFARSW